jgi:hypothetical protein
MKVAGWSLVGAGVVAGGLAGYFGQLAKSKADKITEASKMGLPFDPAVEQSGKSANLTAIVLAGAGGACLVTGAILVILGRTPAPATADAQPAQTAHASVSPWITVGGGVVGAGAHLRF